jgi:hypothetical protein
LLATKVRIPIIINSAIKIPRAETVPAILAGRSASGVNGIGGVVGGNKCLRGTGAVQQRSRAHNGTGSGDSAIERKMTSHVF